MGYLSLPFAAMLVCAACGAERSAPVSKSSEAGPMAPPPSSATAPAPARGGGGGGVVSSSDDLITQPVSLDEANQSQAAAEAFNRKIIRNGEIVLVVDDPAAAQAKVSNIAESSGGFVVTSEISLAGSSSPTVAITMRVPADKFGPAMEALHAVGTRVEREKTTGQDVTEEYIDLEARIRTKQALEAQFLEIMKQAHTVSDALEVQRQISEVRGEIEQLEGRRRFLENQSSLSTIHVTLHTPAAVVTTTGTTFGDQIKRAFGDSIDTASAIVIGFIRLLGVGIPVFLMIILPISLLLRFLWRRMQRSMASTPAPPPFTPAPPPSE
jgi:hypothetical protein